jgi:dethiobiotin synthetase
MKRPVLFITGTDTGVGKTVLTCLLTRYLRIRGVAVAALKPISSGNRHDARALREALGRALSLNEINPWHFREPLAPLLAARRLKRKVSLRNVVDHVGAVRQRFDMVLLEGAGGLLSPLGEGFDARDLIVAQRAIPLIVCPNRLGAINQTRLVLDALPSASGRRAQVVLISQPRTDRAARTNRELLGELIGVNRVHLLPWLPRVNGLEDSFVRMTVRKTLARLAAVCVEAQRA